MDTSNGKCCMAAITFNYIIVKEWMNATPLTAASCNKGDISGLRLDASEWPLREVDGDYSSES